MAAIYVTKRKAAGISTGQRGRTSGIEADEVIASGSATLKPGVLRPPQDDSRVEANLLEVLAKQQPRGGFQCVLTFCPFASGGLLAFAAYLPHEVGFQRPTSTVMRQCSRRPGPPRGNLQPTTPLQLQACGKKRSAG
eukprot:CAMPEP_0197625956 /NCGR_PEP_ID=MMETSP1338-20131121/5152_1 /TAXON_ID=43686 ORGANISM="Pelagodinium beii, Strain RCC1491" /NCGR_SAMPLE_ID=MMETSP1338 /ASSEMBLY_ACC=CAM_ASM_000754 /LENGTH=136 /DNA_ID=CAMNT_0043196469 /DNA_START=545 /DNA_END=957 /DNA_ORIENTATION=-